MTLALAGLALMLPATASAKIKAAAADPYKVLVVTSTDDALSTAGKAAIQAAAGSDFTVTAPAPADVGAQFTPENLDQYRAVVFLNTGQASPLNDAQRANFEAYYKKGGGFVGIGSAIETDSAWTFLNGVLGARSSGRTGSQSGTVKVADRVHDASKSLPRYWDRTESWYNFTTNVRGISHVLATVVEDPFSAQPQGNTLDGIADGTMGADHPVSWCKDYQAGRSFYTALGTSAASFDADLTKHLKGAISWASGHSDPVYSDCGATVIKNFQQVKISGPPNTNEPISFDQLPDGRIIQTARPGTLRLHDPVKGTTTVLADFNAAATPSRFRLYTVSEDGLYGPGIDNNFAQNHWIYLYYSPLTVTDVKISDGSLVTQTTPTTGSPPATAASKAAWDPWIGYFQLSRFKFVDDGVNPPYLDFNSEQQILRVPVNRGNCCHVAGDMDWDKHNNMYFVTGDDNEAGGINGGGFGPMNDQLTDEQQTVRVTNATGGTFTLTFNGQTTAPLAYNASAAQVDAALEALSNVGANNVQAVGGPVNTTNVSVYFRRSLQQANQNAITADGGALTGGTVAVATATEGGLFQNPIGDTRRGAANTNDLRGKVVRIKVKDGDITAADANKADYGSGTGAYTIPAGNLFPLVAGAPQAKTRPEVYAMGFRNPFRIQVDENDVAYVTDYSPDSRTPQRGRGPAGTGRMEIVRKASNYGWPMCYSSKLAYYKWSYHEWAPTVPVTPAPSAASAGMPPNNVAEKIDCGGPSVRNESRWVRDGGPANEPGLQDLPPVTDPDIWYSYNDNLSPNPLGTPCQAYAEPTAGPAVPGSTTECARLFPELGSGGVGPHGAAKYHYDASNPSATKFPPYYDNSIMFGEFTRDFLREVQLDDQNRIFKINQTLNCGDFTTRDPILNPFECDAPMDVQFGSDGDFYMLTYGDSFFQINPDAGMYKFEYVKGQRAPKAVMNADRTDGASPLTVNFTSAGSLDEDPGESIRFEWDFGDGSPISEEANPTHVYTTRGRFTAILSVIDSSGKKTSVSLPITSGNTSPTITIDTPVRGGTFAFGDTIPYSVTVTDPEDGAVKCSDVQVTFVLGHDSHGHAEEGTTGCSGQLHTIADDVSHGGNVFGIINARYTDKGGAGGVPELTTIVDVRINQRKNEVENVVTQSGTNVAPTDDLGGGSHRSAISNNDWVQLNGPFNLQGVNSLTFRVADGPAGRTAGSPLAAVEVRQDSITGPIVGTANLVSTGGPTVWTSQTIPVSMAGTHELFLVFRSVTGGAPSNNNPGLFFLNWVEFNGKGITEVTSSAPGTVVGTVPATLALSLSGTASFGAFTPGTAKDYTAETTANVISSAGDAALSVSDPGRLTNGAFSLPEPLQVELSKTAWTAPVSNDKVTVTFKQHINANDALRTGSYSKTVTFTLSTTSP